MTDWLVQKYIKLFSPRLKQFKQKGPTLYNFRCPICNDSEKSKTKSRGYFYEKKGDMKFHCHNCGNHTSAMNLIKKIDPNLYSEYLYEKIQEEKPQEEKDLEAFVNKMKPPVFLKFGPLKGLKKVSQLSPNDPVKKFVVDRMIPNPYHAKLLACPNFMSFVNGIIKNKFSEDALKMDETRLIIPFLDKNKNVHAFQGRSLGDSQAKYITIVINEKMPKVFGMDTVDFTRKVPVFEGPIDAMFVNNAISTAGGDMVPALREFDRNQLILVYDNEPRKKETVNKIEKVIMQGYNVCIFPENFEHKDINDAIKAGISQEFMNYIIHTNVYKDLTAQLKFNQWKKI